MEAEEKTVREGGEREVGGEVVEVPFGGAVSFGGVYCRRWPRVGESTRVSRVVLTATGRMRGLDETELCRRWRRSGAGTSEDE